jgi:hypothetical protein
LIGGGEWCGAPNGRLEQFRGFLNSAENLCIACGECNITKKNLQQGTLVFAKHNASNTAGIECVADAIQPLQQPYDPERIFNSNNIRVHDMVMDSLESFVAKFFYAKIPVIHVHSLALITLSSWSEPHDAAYFKLRLSAKGVVKK